MRARAACTASCFIMASRGGDPMLAERESAMTFSACDRFRWRARAPAPASEVFLMDIQCRCSRKMGFAT